jgi:ERF superfamily
LIFLRWRIPVQRSSETIGTIAAALAKAQAQLVNPEKSLVATIRSDEASGSDRSFRYAPLSSGLDIVRKTLSQHEIATVQTTSIDETGGIVRLSTVLAHASGEWIASDWPVCSVSDTATPHRMGAALTYARRYVLFTLVGIAGEDDLDAPDLVSPTAPETKVEPSFADRNSHLNGGQRHSTQPSEKRSANATASKSSGQILETEASAALRDRLTAEIKELRSADKAASWAHRVLGAKNTLTTADALHVEQAFQLKIASFPAETEDEPNAPGGPQDRLTKRRMKRRSRVVNKSVLTLPAPRRIRDREHVKSVAKQACLICGRRPADAHHLRFAQPPALGRKVSDEFTVPLCRGHHREAHHCGDEVAWWNRAGIEPTVTARALWLKTHPLPTAHTCPKVTTSVPTINSQQSDSKGSQPVTRGGRNNKTKPISESSSL